MLTLTPQSGMMMVMLCQLYSGAQGDPVETQLLEEHQQRQMSTMSHAGVYTDCLLMRTRLALSSKSSACASSAAVLLHMHNQQCCAGYHFYT